MKGNRTLLAYGVGGYNPLEELVFIWTWVFVSSLWPLALGLLLQFKQEPGDFSFQRATNMVSLEICNESANISIWPTEYVVWSFPDHEMAWILPTDIILYNLLADDHVS